MLRRRSPIFLLLLAAACWCGSPARAQTVDFEDLLLDPEDYENGENLSGFFMSGGVMFTNAYDMSFGNWDGWAYSNVTDVTTPGFGNQYSAYNLPGGGGAGGSNNYGVAFVPTPFPPDYNPEPPRIVLPSGSTAVSIDATNVTYTALSMRDGDGFAKKFGGVTGDDPDYLLLTVFGYYNSVLVGSIDFYLADFRAANNADDYIIDEWSTVYLNSLGTVDELSFGLTTTDNGIFGPNTPMYFAADNLVLAAVPEPGSMTLALVGVVGLWRMRKRRKNDE